MYDFSEFKPRKKGMGKVLGDLEAEVMESVWSSSPCSVRDVYERLLAKRRIAYTTVMTIMSRLADKGLLIKEKEGAAFRYSPAVSRDEFRARVASEVIHGLLDGFGKEAFSRLIEETRNADPQVIAELERLIEERKKQR